MAKKASGAIGGASSTSPKSEKPAEKLGRRGTPPSETRQKPSSLLDTRVVYCGGNLEQPEQMQKDEGRMMKPARLPILHSSFLLLPLPHYHCDWHASHYIKVMLDQIFANRLVAN